MNNLIEVTFKKVISIFILSVLINTKTYAICLADTINSNKEIQCFIDNNSKFIDDFNELQYKYDQILMKIDSIDFYFNGDSIKIDEISNIIISDFDKEKEKNCTLNKVELIKNLKPKFENITTIEKHKDSLIKNKLSRKKDADSLSVKINNNLLKINKLRDSISKLIVNDTNSFLLNIKFRGKSYRIIIVRNKSNEISLFDNHKMTSQSLNDIWNYSLSKKKKPLAVLNGGMYKTDYTPQGLLIEKFKEKQQIDTTNDPKNRGLNFYLYPNGVFFTDSLNQYYVVTTNEFIKRNRSLPKVKYATQSGPMLVINNKVNSKFTYNSKNLNIRNGVGVSNSYSNKIAYFAISDNPVSLYDFSMLFKDILGCNNALYLDGAISKMYTSEKNITTGDLGGQFGPIILIEKK
jgi:uncharacterized protein YigE (DUF2233 family)